MSDPIERPGYTQFKISTNMFQGLFSKYAGNGWFVTVTLQTSHLFDSKWTANIYLGKTATYGEFQHDIPFDCFKRPPVALSDEQRDSIGLPRSPSDIWWSDLSPHSIDSFIRCLALAEKNMLSDNDLKSRITKKYMGRKET